MAALLKQSRALQQLRIATLPLTVRSSGRKPMPFGTVISQRFLSEEKVTHTGQVFAEDDFRRARFVDKQKEVNPNFSQDLISEVPPIEVDARVVSCDGGGGALGHPKIYINLDPSGPHSCGYCGLQYVQKAH